MHNNEYTVEYWLELLVIVECLTPDELRDSEYVLDRLDTNWYNQGFLHPEMRFFGHTAEAAKWLADFEEALNA